MQTPKEPTRLNILQASQEEFLRVGFEKASMRRISHLAGVSTSNIYNYFDGKEELLKTLVKPAIDGIEKGISLISDDDYIDKRLQYNYETLQKRFQVVLDYVDEHRKTFKLLMFHSNGSAYENSLSELLNRVTKLNVHQLNYYKNTHGVDLEVNEFIVRNLISFFLNVFVEMVKNDISRAEILKIQDQILKFLHSGIKAIFLDK